MFTKHWSHGFFIEEKIIRKSEGVNSFYLHVKKNIKRERERKIFNSQFWFI